MIDAPSSPLPPLPLMLWETPPGLELALAQEGVPFVKVREPHPLAFRAGSVRAVRRPEGRRRLKVRACLSRQTTPRSTSTSSAEGSEVDPFRALIDTEGARGSVVDRGAIRWSNGSPAIPRPGSAGRLIDRLRRPSLRAGRDLGEAGRHIPFPYRSAFNLRLDLDEPEPEDYFNGSPRPVVRSTTARPTSSAPAPMAVSRRVLDDLRRSTPSRTGITTSSTATPRRTARNLERAHRILRRRRVRGPRGSPAPTAGGTRGSTGSSKTSATRTHPTSSSATTTSRSSPGGATGSRRSSRSRSIRSAKASSSRPAATPGWSPTTSLRVILAKIEAREPAFVYGHPEASARALSRDRSRRLLRQSGVSR